MGDFPRDTYITLLLFLLGIPALVFQMASDDVRRVLLNPRNLLRSSTLVIPGGIAALLTITLLWIDNFWKNPDYDYTGLYHAGLVIMLLLACYVMGQVLRLVVKTFLVRNLARYALREVRRRKGSFNNGILGDLIILGQESTPGEEKNEVIQALERIVDGIIRLPGYEGNQLSELIHALGDVVLEGATPSSIENLIQAMELLRKVKQAYDDRQHHEPTVCDVDLDAAYRLLSRLGCEAVRFPVDGAAMVCVDVIQGSELVANPAASQSMREIGIAAIEHNKIMVATYALGYLDAVIFSSDTLPEQREIVHDYLGLLAFFWGHGLSGRKNADLYLVSLGQVPGVSLAHLINQAIQHHRAVNRFAIADQISTMWREMNEGYS
jgi:hypothetical protein